MEAMRVVQKPKNGKLTIELPENLAKKSELEIIILPTETSSVATKEARKAFNPSDYFGSWKDKKIDVDKLSREIREEWDRGF